MDTARKASGRRNQHKQDANAVWDKTFLMLDHEDGICNGFVLRL